MVTTNARLPARKVAPGRNPCALSAWGPPAVGCVTRAQTDVARLRRCTTRVGRANWVDPKAESVDRPIGSLNCFRRKRLRIERIGRSHGDSRRVASTTRARTYVVRPRGHTTCAGRANGNGQCVASERVSRPPHSLRPEPAPRRQRMRREAPRERDETITNLVDCRVSSC